MVVSIASTIGGRLIFSLFRMDLAVWGPGVQLLRAVSEKLPAGAGAGAG